MYNWHKISTQNLQNTVKHIVKNVQIMRTSQTHYSSIVSTISSALVYVLLALDVIDATGEFRPHAKDTTKTQPNFRNKNR